MMMLYVGAIVRKSHHNRAQQSPAVKIENNKHNINKYLSNGIINALDGDRF